LQEQSENIFELTIVMPCLNEAETVGLCVRKAKSFLEKYNIYGEVIVADNGSTDGSQGIAEENGARVVFVKRKGYGSALIGGITAANSKFIIMGDSDDSHDLENLYSLVEKLREGFDLVVGNRFTGGIDPGAMSFANRYIGNPFLSGVGRVFFKSKVRDFHCGLRGFTKEAFERIDLRTTGMEFASEMIVKATLFDLKVTEVPTRMLPSGRSRAPHLRPVQDGWRHLRFLLLYSPRWLFLYPGIALIAFGFIVASALLPGSLFSLDVHTMLYASAGIIIGLHSVSFAVLTKTFAVQEKLLPEHMKLSRLMKLATLENGLIVGLLLIGGGVGLTLYSVALAGEGGFTVLNINQSMRLIIPSITLLIIGFQVIFSSFFFSILRLKVRANDD
jgi:glycosyltransferase involved in cell wall biosynthesis